MAASARLGWKASLRAAFCEFAAVFSLHLPNRIILLRVGEGIKGSGALRHDPAACGCNPTLFQSKSSSISPPNRKPLPCFFRAFQIAESQAHNFLGHFLITDVQ